MTDTNEGQKDANHIYTSLRTLILLGGLAAGSVMAASTVARRFASNRKAAREAFALLEAEGLVESKGADTAAVANPDAPALGNIESLAHQWRRQVSDSAATPGSDYP